MVTSYKFSTVKHGKMEEICNERAAEGYSVDEVLPRGDSFYVLFSKWEADSDDDIEVSLSDEIWDEYRAVEKRLDIVEGALALRIDADASAVEDAEEAPASE